MHFFQPEPREKKKTTREEANLHTEGVDPSLERALTMSTDGAARVAAHVSLAYFAVALAVTWLRPVWGGYVSSPRFVSALVVASRIICSESRAPTRLTRLPRRHPRTRSVLLGVGLTIALQALAAALLLRAATPPPPPAGDAPTRSRDSAKRDGDESEEALAADAWRDLPRDDEDARRHRGWLVLVWASVAPTPPEKPERGERAFATLADGELLLRRERGGDVVSRVDLSGAEVRLCRAPGKWDDALDAEDAEGLPRTKKKRHGFGAEKRWWKRLPIVLSHPTRALHRGHRVLWCYALSDAAKEAWTVALHKSLAGATPGADPHAAAAALAATSRARSLTRDVDAFRAWLRETASLSAADAANAADAGWASGGAAGAAINALASRIFFDMQRSPEKIAEVTEQLAGLCSGIPDLPRFVGPISVSNVHLGKSTPQVLAARLPPAAKPGTSAAPWDGGTLAGRGACAAAELEVDFAGVAEMTLTTHLDLSVYAEMIAAEEGDGGAEDADSRDSNDSARNAAVESAAPSSSVSGNGGGGAEEQIRRLRSLAKKNASKLIGAVARKMAGVPISMTVKIKRLAGTTRVWIPPPPGDRLWFGFVGEPVLEMEATPSFGQIGIKWHGLAERVSEAITKQLLREIHAALVLPNGGNLILDPLEPFEDVPEMSVRALLEMGKTSQASMRDRVSAARDAVEEEKGRNREPDGPSGPSPRKEAAAFHTPSASLAVEVEDAVLGLPGGKAEDDAEEAVAAMVDSFLSVGSRAADDDDDDDDVDVAARALATDEWTASPSPSLVSRSQTGDGMAGSDTATAAFASNAVDPDADPEATRDADDEKKTRAPSSPGGGRVLDFHFGAPFPPARGESHSSASSEEIRARRTTPSPAEPNNDLASNIGRFAAGFAAKAARARASMRKDAASVHEGVRRGGVKGGLDVAKSIAARAAKELKH